MTNKISIIILTYNNLKYTKNCIDSIKKYTKDNTYEIIIIDNNSIDGTRDWLKKQKNIKIILNDDNKGFPIGCNQGIEIADKENDILLLNNDTIVTKNWLENLKICLYSDNKIGAVGSVCNQNENMQGVDFTYDNLETMQKLAEINNKLDSNKWEEKVFLIGFCLLIKREVIEKIKKLDVNYTPGYIEDNDLSLRIISLGYKLILCHDSFIHHYLGTSFRKDLDKFYPILNKNRQYFKRKWKFNTFCFDEIKNYSLPLIENPKKILEVNCGIGITLLNLKYKYKNLVIEGVQEDKNKYIICSKIFKTYHNLREIKNQKYDYILIGNYLEQVNEPSKFLEKIKKYMKDDGFIIGEIHNLNYITTLKELENGIWYEKHKNEKNNFTIQDVDKLLFQCNFKKDNSILWKYNNIDDSEINNDSKYFYYSFRYKKN